MTREAKSLLTAPNLSLINLLNFPLGSDSQRLNPVALNRLSTLENTAEENQVPLILKKLAIHDLSKTSVNTVSESAEAILGVLFRAAIAKRQEILAAKNSENLSRKSSALSAKAYGAFLCDDILKDGVSALIPPHHNLKRKISRQFLDAIVNMAAGFKDGKAGFITQAPTGTGKSFLIGMLTATMPQGSAVLISVPNKDLLEQTVAYISRFNPDKKISYISSNKFSENEQQRLGKDIKRGLDGDIVLAVNDSLARLADGNLSGISTEEMKSFKPSLCIVDEVHKINSRSPANQKILGLLADYMKSGTGFIGVSATPDNLKVFNEASLDAVDNLTVKRIGNTALFTKNPIENLFAGQVLQLERVFEKSLADSIKDKELSPIKWHGIKMSDLNLFQNVAVKDLDEDGDIKDTKFNQFLDSKAGADEKTNWDLITDIIAKKISTDDELKNLRAVSFAPNIEKSKSLAKALDSHGIRAASYTGKGIFISNDLIELAKNYRKNKYGSEFQDGFRGKITKDSSYQGFSIINDSDTHAAYNKRLLFSMLENKDLKNVTSVEKLHTGIDFPWLDLALLTPTASHSKYMQMLGRVTRLDPQNPLKKAHVIEVLLDGNAVFQPFNIASATGMTIGARDSSSSGTSRKNLITSSEEISGAPVELKSLDQYSGFISLSKLLSPLLKDELDGRFRSVLKELLVNRATELMKSSLDNLSDSHRADAIPRSELVVRVSGVEKYNPLIWAQVQQQLKSEIKGITELAIDSMTQERPVSNASIYSSPRASSIKVTEAKKNLLINLAGLRFPFNPLITSSSYRNNSASNSNSFADIQEHLDRVSVKYHIEKRYILFHLRDYQQKNGSGIHRRIDSDAKNYLKDPLNERTIADAAMGLRDLESHLHLLKNPFDAALFNTYSTSKYAREKYPGRSVSRFTENSISEDGFKNDKAISKSLWTEIQSLKSAQDARSLADISVLSDNYINLKNICNEIAEKMGFNLSDLDPKPRSLFESNVENFIKRLLKKDDLNILDSGGEAVACLSLAQNQIENLKINDDGTFELASVKGLAKDDFQRVLESLDKILKIESMYLYQNKAFPKKEGFYLIPNNEQINAYAKWVEENREDILARIGLDAEAFNKKAFRDITDHSLTKSPAIAMKISYETASGEKKLLNLYSEFIKSRQSTVAKLNLEKPSDDSLPFRITEDNFRNFLPAGRNMRFEDLFTNCDACQKFLKRNDLNEDEIRQQHLDYSRSRGLIIIKSEIAQKQIIK